MLHRGHRLVYDDYGGPEAVGAPLVYLHGLLLDSDINRGIAEALAGVGRRVILCDLLGHGRSDGPVHAAEYRIDDYADQVFTLMDALGLDAAVLGGLSLGANVSLFAATQQPERVLGLVLEMPVLERAVPTAALLFAPMLVAAHYGRPITEPVARALRRLPPTPWRPINSLIGAAAMPPEQMAAVLHGVLVGPVAPTQDARAAIVTPTLVLAHRTDLIHPFADARALVDRMPHAVLIPSRSPLELRLVPSRLIGEIAAFLSSLGPLAGGSARRGPTSID